MKKQIQKIITTISLATVIGLSVAFVEQGVIYSKTQDKIFVKPPVNNSEEDPEPLANAGNKPKNSHFETSSIPKTFCGWTDYNAHHH